MTVGEEVRSSLDHWSVGGGARPSGTPPPRSSRPLTSATRPCPAPPSSNAPFARTWTSSGLCPHPISTSSPRGSPSRSPATFPTAGPISPTFFTPLTATSGVNPRRCPPGARSSRTPVGCRCSRSATAGCGCAPRRRWDCWPSRCSPREPQRDHPRQLPAGLAAALPRHRMVGLAGPLPKDRGRPVGSASRRPGLRPRVGLLGPSPADAPVPPPCASRTQSPRHAGGIGRLVSARAGAGFRPAEPDAVCRCAAPVWAARRRR